MGCDSINGMTHQLGFIGLGKMGKNMVLHALEAGVDIIAYNRTKDVMEEFDHVTVDTFNPTSSSTQAGVFIPVYEIRELVEKLHKPRVIFLMVVDGAPVDEVISHLLTAGITSGDVIIDGGNSYWKDSVRRSKELKEKGINFIDCGTSGGLDGGRHGACLMLGGEKVIVDNLSWLWQTLSGKGDALQDVPLQDEVSGGWTYFGPAGAGHFVKMVHNGVEYGMNQAIGEGFEILSRGPFSLDFAKVAHNWSQGSVIRGWLMELLAKALDKDPKLEMYTGKVGGGQTGTWTLETAKEFGVDTPVLNDALVARKKSLIHPTFAGKVISALRAAYGGHKEPV